MYKKLFDFKTGQDSISVILRIADNASIPFDPDNTDYQAYLKWVADGGTPLPAESN